jgi:hypothetical protein
MLRFGTLASRYSPLVLLPYHQSTGSCSSTQKPASDSRPLYAGRRLPSHQAPDRLVPEGLHASGFGDAKLLNDASSMGSLSFVFRTHTCSRSCLKLLLQRSPPRLFTAAAWSGLRPAPESRSRGAHPHLSRSFTTQISLRTDTLHTCVSAAHRGHETPVHGEFANYAAIGIWNRPRQWCRQA